MSRKRKSLPRHVAAAPKGMQSAPRSIFARLPWLGPLALFLLTALVYARSLAVPILEWDDYVYLFRDARLDQLSAENLWRIMTQSFFANFHPVTTLTFAFDRAVWGTWVPGFHLTHLAFYIGGVLGLYFLFARLLGSRPAAFAAAAIYSVHTIHVESVAWLASRKDVVCLFFYALSLLAYVRYAGGAKNRLGPYLLALVLAAAAMLSKGYAVILPAVMVAYDLCYSGRITRRQILDKIPFLALAAATILLTVHAQDRDTALIQSTITGERRVALLAKIFALYVGRSMWPTDLSAFYVVAGKPVEGWLAALGIVLATGAVIGFFLWRRKLPAAAFGIALLLLPLGTVMNLIYTLRIWMSDRYLFFPSIGLCLIAVAVASSVGSRDRQRHAGARAPRRLLTALAALAICFYSALTVSRIEVWTSPIALWSDVMRKALDLKGSGPITAGELSRVSNLQSIPSVALQSLVRAYESAGKGDEAQKLNELLGTVVVGGPEEREMAAARQDLEAGRYAEVIRRLKPIADGGSWLAPQATIWIGIAQSRMGNTAGSLRTFNQAIELYRKTGQPTTDALFSIGAMEFNNGNYQKAAQWYRLAHEESPREARSAFHLARALEEGGYTTDALALYERIAAGEFPIQTGSQFTILEVYSQMEVCAEKLGRTEDAIRYLEEILRLAPNLPEREAVLARIASLRRSPK